MFSPAQALAFTTTATPAGALWQAPLPAGIAGGWVRISVSTPATACWIKLAFTDTARLQVVRELFLRPPRPHGSGEARKTLVHVPAAAESLTLHVYGDTPTHAVLTIARSGRIATTLSLLRQFWPLLPSCLSGHPLGLLGRCRAVLGQAPARAGEVPPYSTWITLFEDPQPPPGPPYATLGVLITSGDAAALQSTRASLDRQTLPPTCIHTPADRDSLPSGWIVILSAGEILHPHALAWFASTIAASPQCACITADTDTLGNAGLRTDPLFKPGADPMLLASGLLTTGACAVNWRQGRGELPDAATLRAEYALHAGDAMRHIPRVLTHCPPMLASASPSLFVPSRESGTVTAIIPSQARSRHARRSITAISRQTDVSNLRIRVALAQPDRAKPAILRALRRLPNVTIADFPMQAFNYAKVNNLAAAGVDSEFLLLLNDDVAPINPDWLGQMLAQMADPRVGIVGARLLYGNGMVQHEGVILGLANLAEHAGRLRDSADPGPHGLGLITRQVSAVTAACLLIRASLFRELGGMDENYVIALNDVDLCLRARAAGWRVIYCAQACLTHYESLSLGRHYQGARAGLEAVETRRLRQSWASVIESDPFYNPQASLQPGREWCTAFAPRGPGFPVTHPNLPA